jgi:mannose-6-phosphate isomerase-like protein (cupin superfamily)
MKLLTTPGIIDRRNTMYPSILALCENSTYTATPYSTVYGYVLSGTVSYQNITVSANHYFSASVEESQEFLVNGKAVLISRLGFRGQNTTGGPLENIGRLSYIDGCSDSLLVYPPRQGDASLNALYFPENINQTFHIHPSIRMGIIVAGEGVCDLDGQEIALSTGSTFCLDVMERHRFKTTNSKMIVIAYHPDGDWGPTDHNHTMLNRTYIK